MSIPLRTVVTIGDGQRIIELFAAQLLRKKRSALPILHILNNIAFQVLSQKEQKKELGIDPILLQDQLQGYQKAEITLLIAEKTQSKDFFNLLTLIELVPAEQADSLPVGDERHPNVIRANTDEYTLYAIRLTGLTITEAVSIYANANKGLTINFKEVQVDFRCRGGLTENPPASRPLLITETDRQLRPVLPQRHTSIRVWTQLNMDKEWVSDLSHTFMRKVSELSNQLFGYDLNAMPEHLGNVYLFGCNPLLRSWECRLADHDKALLFRFNQRAGQRISASKLVLEEVRGDQGGFYLEQSLDAEDTLITLPYFPDRLHLRLFDAHGHWIDHSFLNWANFAFDLAIQDRVVDYRVQTESDVQVFSVPKRLSEQRVSVGTYDWAAAHFLRDALASRRFEDLAKSREFIFFPKKPESLPRAKETIRELLNGARKRCMILDPYFGAADMLYIYQIENISLTVRVISSAAYLNERPRSPQPPEPPGWRGLLQRLWIAWRGKPANTAKTYMENLFGQLTEYAAAMPLQKIECRVLRGEKSPLHDRFVVIDDEVYLLGSSLNEFGSRTTTISRVPAPGELIDQAEAWWADNDVCPTIDELIAKKKTNDVEA
nr:VPA1262 family N-terminal domain-containing protein [uncultured Dyadobacter sp.]